MTTTVMDAAMVRASAGVALTRTRQEFSSAGMVAALEAAWQQIRAHHSEVPAAVLIVGPGSPVAASGRVIWGHFVDSQWQHGTDVLSEVLISGEGLARTPDEVLETLLHEAAHGLAFVRQVQDTSRQGRWHNKRFVVIAQELGLVGPGKPCKRNGWSDTTLAAGTLDAYRDVVAELDAAVKAYRFETTPGAGKPKPNPTVALVCRCKRRIRATKTVAEAGHISCGLCRAAFVENDGAS